MMEMIPNNKKLCPFCNEVKFKSQFSKRKNTDDGLSPCCKVCIKFYKQWYLWNFNDIDNMEIVTNFLRKNKKIKINGIDKNKLKKITIKVQDIPGIMTPILKTLPMFLIKYNLTFDEFVFIISKCQKNEFYFT